MQITIYWPWELLSKINGNAVIFDINAATTNICMILSRGVKRLFIVNEQNVADLKEKNIDSFVTGESKILKKNFFDANNCTDQIAKLPLKGKTVLYMSNNGSKTIELAIKKDANNVLICSYTNIHTIASWINKNKNEPVFLIPSGDKGLSNPKAIEDILCVQTLIDILSKKEVNWKKIFVETKAFIKSKYADFTEEETEIQLAVDRFPVLPICLEDKNGLIEVKNGLL